MDNAQAHQQYTEVRRNDSNERHNRPSQKRKGKIDPNFKQLISQYIKDPEWKSKLQKEKLKKSSFIHQTVPSEMQL